jgi:hypothetical protein
MAVRFRKSIRRPQAGLKLAWNYRYHDSFNFPGGGATIVRRRSYAVGSPMPKRSCTATTKDNIWREGILYKELSGPQPEDVKKH